MIIFRKIAGAIKKFCSDVNNAIRNWLLDCLNAVDREAFDRMEYRAANWHTQLLDMTSRMRAITVSIPSTMAPWYEDEMFSRKMWDEMRTCGVKTFETSDKKWANVIVIAADKLDQ